MRVDAYFSRPRLFERGESARSRVVVIQAPGGFGKTTMLAEMYRHAREHGVLTGWLTMDEDDTEDGIGPYLAYAFERAGLSIPNPGDALDHGLALVANGIEAHDGPCLLVLDDAERITEGAVTAVNSFLRHLPGNLRIAVGMRENPGLDLAGVALDGRDVVLTADQLRFTRQEIVDFFGGELSRRELASVTARTEGWPVALRIYRNMRANEAGTSAPVARTDADLAGDEEITATWLGARLLRNATSEERSFLMDIALFDLIDIALVAKVLGREDAGPMMARLVSLRGLIHPIGDDGETFRLHPLLKDYCAARLRREDPDRYRRLHRKIAVAMEGRGDLIPAMRHASAARDFDLVGDVLERAGGMRLWIREGMVRLGAAERFLTPYLMERRPRLAMLRCRMLAKNGRLAEARQLYQRVKVETRDFARDPNNDSNVPLLVDAVIARAMMTGYGSMPISEELIRDVKISRELSEQEEKPDPAMLAHHDLLLFIAYYQGARFDIASAFAVEARTRYALYGLDYGDFHVTLYEGLLAMAQGRSGEARSRFERVRRIAGELASSDPSRSVIANVPLMELDLECNRTEELEALISQVRMPLRDVAMTFDIRAAFNELEAEWGFETTGGEGALRVVEESHESAMKEGLVCAVRHLSALRVVYLIADDRIDQAAGAWRVAGLPVDLPNLLDLDSQSWREMEAISCARIRLLAAHGDLEAAREVAAGLCAVARNRGLARTRMRCLALWMALEHRAGRENDAAARLLDYLRMFGDTGFIRPLVRERETSVRALRDLLGVERRANIRQIASSALQQIGATSADDPQTWRYTAREIEILECLGRGERDKEIARRFAITDSGVRYHLKNVYRKLGASGRVDAVRRARSIGVIRTRPAGNGNF